MKRKPEVKLKLVSTADKQKPHSPLALNRLDWYSAGLLCAALVLAPVIAGDFATSTSVLPISSVWSLFTAAGVPILLILIAVAYVPFAIREWSQPVAIGRVPGLVPSIALFALWVVLSAIKTPAPYLTVNALALIGAVLLAGGMISRLARDRIAFVALLAAVTAGGVIVALAGTWEYVDYALQHVPEHRSTATFADPNFLAGYLLLTIPVALALFTCATNRLMRWLVGGALVLQSGVLWLSGSRAGSAVVLVEVGLFVCLALAARIGAAQARWLRIGFVLFVIGSLPALTPLISRMAPHRAPLKAAGSGAGVTSGDALVNSNEFRRWTWIGAVRMARTNPVLGTGFGAFNDSYGKYAETAFTAHAHNSYLQVMAEAGYPAAVLLLLCLAAGAAFAAHALVLQRRRHANSDGAETSPAEAPYNTHLVDSPEIMLAGLLAALGGSMLHSLLDSDWYVAANCLTLCALVALAVAVARDLAPLSTSRPAPLSRPLLTAGGVLVVLFIWRGAQLSLSRMYQSLAGADVNIAAADTASPSDREANLSQATEAYHSAAAADPLDPEPLLGLAETATTPEERLRYLNASISVCRTGKAYYRLGQYYMSDGVRQYQAASDAFEHARELQPKMVQNLRALASAYLAAGKTDDAARILKTMTALQKTPYGTVRAVHESVETEFGYAHSMLGDIYAGRSAWTDAAAEYEQAQDVLAEYWRGRNYLVNMQGRSSVKRKELADLYQHVLQQLRTAYTQDATNPQAAALAAAQLARVRQDIQEDQTKDR